MIINFSYLNLDKLVVILVIEPKIKVIKLIKVVLNYNC